MLKPNKKEQNVPSYQSAHAILTLSGNYILQLRDNNPNISAPGQWSLFGGKIENNETPRQAIIREIYEELLLKNIDFQQLWYTDYYEAFEKSIIRTWFFGAAVTGIWIKHRLIEGKEAKSFSIDEIINLDMTPIIKETIVKFHRMSKTGGLK